MKHTFKHIKLVAFTFILGTALSQTANAQMAEKPWGFEQQNRASIAALMKSVENNKANSSIATNQPSSSTTLICGSDGSSSAKGTSSCIILNNSDGSILLDQDSNGNQTATAEDTTNIQETINHGADDVLAALNGK